MLRKRLCGSEVFSQTLASIETWHMTSSIVPLHVNASQRVNRLYK